MGAWLIIFIFIAILAQIYTCNRYSVIKRKFDRLTNQYNTIFKENEENKKYVGFLDKAVSEAKYFRAKYNECSSELTMSQIESKNLLEKLREANTQLQYERNKEQIEKLIINKAKAYNDHVIELKAENKDFTPTSYR